MAIFDRYLLIIFNSSFGFLKSFVEKSYSAVILNTFKRLSIISSGAKLIPSSRLLKAHWEMSAILDNLSCVIKIGKFLSADVLI